MWLVCLQERILERHVFKRDWTEMLRTCLLHSRFRGQHNCVCVCVGGGLYYHSMNTRNFIMILNKKFMKAPLFLMKVAAPLTWIC